MGRELTADSRPPLRALTTLPLVGALYFMVAGGPYGLEELLAGVGAKMALVVIVVTPLVWSLPAALMVGELGAALPEDGGYYAWVRRALGPYLGFQEAWLSLAASVFDMAIYPALFVSYLAHFWPTAAMGSTTVAVEAFVVVAAAALNLRGSKSVGDSSVVMTALLLAPFVVLTICLFVHPPGAAVAASGVPAHVAGKTGLLGAILVAMWNFMGWDNASTLAGEVARPQTTYPRAVTIAVLLVTLTYAIPTAAVAYAGIDASVWTNGAWVDIGINVQGVALGAAIIVGGMLCGFGMQNALVLSYTRIPVALAEDGFLPPAFARRRGKGGAPVVSILVCSFAWMLSLGMSFERLVSLDILLYGLSLLLEFVALAALRIHEPDLRRPYKVPGGTVGACLLGLPPIALLVVAAVKSSEDAEHVLGLNPLLFGVIVAALGTPLYLLTKDRWPAIAPDAAPVAL